MGFSLESRRLIVEKMDKQFASDLDTRRKSNVVKKRASDIYGSLVLLQKGYRSYDTVIFDLKDQAMSNRKRLEDILNRADMRKL